MPTPPPRAAKKKMPAKALANPKGAPTLGSKGLPVSNRQMRAAPPRPKAPPQVAPAPQPPNPPMGGMPPGQDPSLM